MCLHPNRVKNLYGFSHCEYVFFPCGKCLECKAKYIRDWSIRWNEEIKINYKEPSDRLFITLTYSDENLPYTKTDSNRNISTLCYDDVRKFIKRLRIANQRFCEKHSLQLKEVKYQYVGEYGTKGTKRPHYHLFICGLSPHFATPDTIREVWNKGIIDVKSNADVGTVKYIVKYALKNTLKGVKTERKRPKYIFRKINELTEFKFKFSHLNPTIKEIYNFQKGKYHPYTNRVAEQVFSSKEIGKCYLTEAVLNQIKANVLDYKYSTYEPKLCKFMNYTLPRYYWKKVLYEHVCDNTGKKLYKPNGSAILSPNVTDEDFADTLAGQRFYHFGRKYQDSVNEASKMIAQHPEQHEKLYHELQAHRDMQKLKTRKWLTDISKREIDFDEIYSLA